MGYESVVADALKPGFAFAELVRSLNPRKAMPPQKWWSRMVRPLQLANILRERMIARGAKGLLIRAAYRPEGGAKLSAHKFNRALDLDLMPGDYEHARAFYEEAVRLWCELGGTEEIGLGLYCRPGAEGGIRVHIDCGQRTRCWQHFGSRKLSRAQSDIPRIAARLGLAVP